MAKEDRVGDFPAALHKAGKDSTIVASIGAHSSSDGRCQNLIVVQLDSGDRGWGLMFLRYIE